MDIPFVNKLLRSDKNNGIVSLCHVGRRTKSQARCGDRAVLDLEYFWHAYFDNRNVEVMIVKLPVRQLV